MTGRAFEESPLRYARVAGIFYLLTIVTGTIAAMASTIGVVANLVATACYVAVTVLFYWMFRPVGAGLSLLAAIFGLVGCLFGALGSLGMAPGHINALAFFGVYCLLIGYLIFKSTFLPRILGALMAFGGVGWLTFARPALGRSLAPFNMFHGVMGETSMAGWK